MARKYLKAGTLTAPLPPVLVTVGEGDGANIITIAWTGILSTHPARTYISVRPERHSHKLLSGNREFVINLPSADMARVVDYIGIYTGAKVNKFEKTGLTAVPSENVAPPTIKECPVALECRVVEVIPMGTHDVFIADILSVSADEKIFSEEGKLCFDKANLLAYAHGEYYSLGEKLGSFGFSAKKSAPKPQVKKNTPKAKTGGDKGSSATPSGTKGGKASPKGDKRRADVSPKKGAPTREEESVKSTANTEGKRPFYLGIAGKRRSQRGGRR